MLSISLNPPHVSVENDPVDFKHPMVRCMWLYTGNFGLDRGVDTFRLRTQVNGGEFVVAVHANDPRSTDGEITIVAIHRA